MKSITIFRWLTGNTSLLTALAAWQMKAVWQSGGILAYSFWQNRLVAVQISLGVAAVLLAGVACLPLAGRLTERLDLVGISIRKIRFWTIPLVILILALLVFICFGPFFRYQSGRWVQTWLVWLAGLAIGLLLTAGWPKRGLVFWLAGSLLLAEFTVMVGALFSQVSNYPFTTQWSEGMLLVNAAQIVGEKIWGQGVPWPVMNRTHALLQSLSFWLPGDQPLWLHRLWNSILWFGLPLGVTAALGRQLKLTRVGLLFFSMFGYLFLTQGPVYFNLLVMPFIIFLGFRTDRFPRTLIFVLLASIWAGVSRINWFPVPGILAALLYIIEKSYDGHFWRYFWKPIIWVASGTIMAFAANSLVQVLSGNALNHTFTSLQSTLLWYRLWPSATFPLGILPSLALVSIGLLILVTWKFFLQGRFHPVRRVSVLAILFVFLLGGLVVSVKIGGGNNLHNMDAFLVLFGTLAAYTWFARVAPDFHTSGPLNAPVWLGALILVIPILYLAPGLRYQPPANNETVTSVESQLEARIEKSLQAGETVLFISNQQMLAINRFPGVLPEPKYEVVYMMEMAMVGNQAYFEEFYTRLSQHEWGLIIIDSLSLETAGREKSFGEEQTAWVEWVVKPIRKYYIPVGGSSQAQLVIAEPR